ncbi:phage tail protein [Xenophilus aerolatus]|nr:phage tail protein [Xenophilus aerolatus]
MTNPLTLKLILAGATKAVNELKPLDAQSKATAESLKKARDALKLLNGQAAQVEGIRKLQGELGRQSTSLQVLRANLASTARSYGASSEQARAMQAQVDRATAAYEKQRAALAQLRTAATASGIGKLSSDQARLKAEIESTNGAIAQQKARLGALADMNARRAQLGQAYGRTRATAGHLAMGGAAGLGTAYGIRRAVTEPLHQVREYETTTARIESLGLGKAESDKAIEYAKRMKTFGTSVNDNLGLMLDATTAFADVHHAEMVMPTLAKMKFANKAMFGEEQGTENERKFMDMLKVIEARNGLNSKEDFTKQADMVQRVITATGGRVDSTQWLDFIKRGGIAAKSLSSEAMYYQLEPIVQIMGGASAGVATMSAYQNLYQGRTTKRAAANLQKFGLIGDESKVKHDKAGQVSFLDPGALKGADLFRTNQFEWMEKILLPALAAKGLTTTDQVNDAIGSIFSNRTASSLFSQMFMMRDQIRKNAGLNAGAFGIDELDSRARSTVSGQEVEAMARFHDTMREAGKALLPTYISLMNTASSALQRVTEFARENPALAAFLGKAVLWVGLLAVGFGALSLGAAALLGPFAVVRYGLGLFGLQMIRFGPLLSGGIGLLGRLGSAFLSVGMAVGRMGLMLLANPLGIAIALLAGAAFLIYRNWEGIVGGLKTIWDQLGGSFMGVVSTISQAIINWSPLGLFYQAFAGVLSWFGIELPSKFTTFGMAIIQGVASGIMSGLSFVQTAIEGAANATIGWFKEKLGIKSPSRVFMEAGGFIVEGAALGIDRTRPMLRAAALGMAGATAVGMPAMAASFDTRPPLSSPAGGAGAGVVIQGDTITIHINAPAGADAQDFARAVGAELDRRDAAKRARARGAFMDYDN